MTPRARGALWLSVAILHGSLAWAQPSRTYKGMPLAEALKELQARGLRIVFSSAIVPSDLRVSVEPRAASARQVLDELLADHGLVVREGPGGTLQIVRDKGETRAPPKASGSREAPPGDSAPADPVPLVHREFVSVTDSAPRRKDPGVASEVSLDRSDFAGLHGGVEEDPLRALHPLPGVSSLDDFRSDLVVRGSPFRHVGLVVDGVSTLWLRHTFGSGASGSVSMMSSLVVESATLRSGAYPRRHSDRLGAELDLSLRQGSRRRFATHGVVGSAQAAVVTEGPLGEVGPGGSARGSWLLSARHSFLEWPPERSGAARTPFGFSDGLAKVVFDVKPTQRLVLTAIGGASNVDGDEDNLAPNELRHGTNRAGAVSVSWQSTLRPALVVTQRASVVAQRFRSSEPGGKTDEGVNQALAYRAAVSRSLARGVLEGGVLIESTRTRLAAESVAVGSSALQSGYAHVSWPLTRLLTLSSGARVTRSTLLGRPMVSRWLLGEWWLRPGWSLLGSVGASRQPPELALVLRDTGTPELRPERAAHLELAIERRLTNGIRWQATVFNRSEADVIRSPGLYPEVAAGTLVPLVLGDHYVNALRGGSHGVELLVERRSAGGLSGWATYAYGRTQHTDSVRRETFWSDFDQRHTLSLFARYRFPAATSAGATFRAGSGFPIPGYFGESNGRMVVGTMRNQVRLPPYARLDLRADHELRYLRRSFTLFVEALNVLDRANVGLAAGTVDPRSGVADGVTETLLRRRVAAGVVFAF